MAEKTLEKEKLTAEVKKFQSQQGPSSTDDLIKVFEEKQKNNEEMENILEALKTKLKVTLKG